MKVASNLEVSGRITVVVTNGQVAVDWIQNNRSNLPETLVLVAQGFHPYLEILVMLQIRNKKSGLDLNHHLLYFLEEAEGMLREIEALIDQYAVPEKESAD